MNSFASSSDSLTVGQQEEVRGNDGPVVQTKLSAFNICIQGLRDEMGVQAAQSLLIYCLPSLLKAFFSVFTAQNQRAGPQTNPTANM